ncbi:hypothetical protein PLICRDRAFT_180371 [Plicaturopsis crispa FD-325 SS-3]|uniref:Protein kinase domain-containing protein n=1 Tax=Plicaturopsis crispa FD-325 SS-3 TaxID=944288 RepID=A0A0C9SQ88_PLICR|nr:hypothetical protein PLICRDRAFT_180371 [Plicaturopsis crispa FD-325 SS-3]
MSGASPQGPESPTAYLQLILNAHALTTKAHEESNDFVPVEGVVLRSRYLTEKSIDYGGGGTIIQSVDLVANTLVAIKVIHPDRDPGQLEPEERYYDELVKGHGTEIRHFAQLLESFDYKHHACLVYPLYGWDLSQLPFSDTDFILLKAHQRGIITQILHGVRYLHSLGIIHGDLKPANVVLERSDMCTIMIVDVTGTVVARRTIQNPTIRLIDFGNATFVTDTNSVIYGTNRYHPPEITLGFPWSYPADLFAIGCIAAEFFIGRPLFPHTGYVVEKLGVLETIVSSFPPDYRRKIEKVFPGTYTKTIPAQIVYAGGDSEETSQFVDRSTLSNIKALVPDLPLYRFLLCLLNLDPRRRMCVTDALAHEYLSPAAGH